MTSPITPVVASFGAAEGRCNICGDFGPLTEDHTPPKGVLLDDNRKMSLRHIVDRVSDTGRTGQARHFQNGVKYRTLCAKCNNDLGSFSDPALIAFADAMNVAAASGVPVASVRCDVQAVMRSVVGHMCAIGVDRFDKGDATEPVKRYMQDRLVQLPDTLRLFWWAFPFAEQVHMKDAGMFRLRKGAAELTTYWLLKFYPLAFLLTFNAPGKTPFDQAPEMSLYRSVKRETIVDLEVTLNPVLPPQWAEVPMGDWFVISGADSLSASPPPKRPA